MPITAFGQTLSVGEWAARSGINPATIKARLYRQGWPAVDAVSRPITIRTPVWLDEHVVVMAGAAAGEHAHETAARLGWTEEHVLRRRKQAIHLLGARNLVNAVAMLVRDGRIEF